MSASFFRPPAGCSLSSLHTVRAVLLFHFASLAGLAACAPDTDAASNELAGESVEQSESSLQTRGFDFSVALRGTGSANIHATVFSNEWLRRGETVLAVHGLAETGATFEPLARTVFRDRVLARRVKRIVAIDLVGHGKSGFPEGLPDGAFGQLTIDDNISVVLQAIDALSDKGLTPTTIVGHSMGGLTVQAVQEVLLAKGESLADHGITKAVLLAPVPGGDQPWVRPPSADVSSLLVTDPVLGTYLALPPALFIAQAFSTTAGVPAANAPSEQTVTERGYSAFEPFATLAQLVGIPLPTPAGDVTLPRPPVRAGAFAEDMGTSLALLSFSEDTLVPAENLGGLYTYLTGDGNQEKYVTVVADDAVHAMYISNPAAFVKSLRDTF
jgi:pimeloyl-ACP methyl ester carboxylesterase